MKFSPRNSFLPLAAFVLLFASCEDVVPIDLADGVSQVVVDAFITNEAGQEIKITKTQPYFETGSNPALEGAEVYISYDDGTQIPFDETAAGTYVNSLPIEEGSMSYELIVEWEDEVYKATSELNPVPPIDTLLFYQEQFNGPEPEWLVEFIAFDVPNSNDFYWIQHYRNDTLYSDAQDILYSNNGSFTGPGSGDLDGGLFILPFRLGVNGWETPSQPGDNVTIEIWSITQDCHDFFNEVEIQATNASAGLFATPPANIRTNILNADPNSNDIPLGYFSLSKVSRRSGQFPQ